MRHKPGQLYELVDLEALGHVRVGDDSWPYGDEMLDASVREGLLKPASRKRERQLEQQLATIKNRMIGNERIWILDRLAMELDLDADTRTDLTDEQRDNLRKDALFIRRLEWDLGELHVAVRGDTARRGGRFDQSAFRGPRP